jgi:hypothetical protein
VAIGFHPTHLAVPQCSAVLVNLDLLALRRHEIHTMKERKEKERGKGERSKERTRWERDLTKGENEVINFIELFKTKANVFD